VLQSPLILVNQASLSESADFGRDRAIRERHLAKKPGWRAKLSEPEKFALLPQPSDNAKRLILL
jgi:hypothetical protein